MNVLLRPYITEKSLGDAAKGRYTFVVHPDANKLAIQKAVQTHFDVEVSSVQTRNVKAEAKKSRTNGKKMLTKAFKKAVVTLKGGKKLDMFEISTEPVEEKK